MSEASSATRIVCFDLGGVVVRICRAWGEGVQAAGLDDRGEMERVLQSDAWSALVERYQSGAMPLAEFSTAVSGLIDGLYSPDELTRVHRAWIVGWYDGVAELVDDIHAAGLETAILSNTCAEHWEQMRSFPAMQRLRNQFGSHQLAVCKPDPAAFRAVEAHTGLGGDAFLYFDDLLANVEAARAVGWHAVHVDSRGDTAAQMRRALRPIIG